MKLKQFLAVLVSAALLPGWSTPILAEGEDTDLPAEVQTGTVPDPQPTPEPVPEPDPEPQPDLTPEPDPEPELDVGLAAQAQQLKQEINGILAKGTSSADQLNAFLASLDQALQDKDNSVVSALLEQGRQLIGNLPAEKPENNKDKEEDKDKDQEKKPEKDKEEEDKDWEKEPEKEEEPEKDIEEKEPEKDKQEAEENKEEEKQPEKEAAEPEESKTEEKTAEAEPADEKKTEDPKTAETPAEPAFQPAVSAPAPVRPWLGVLKVLDKKENHTLRMPDKTRIALLPDFDNEKAWLHSKSPYNYPGLWGQCTWFAWGRFYELYGFDPGFTGNGYACANQLVQAHPGKFKLSETPKAGAVFSSDVAHNHVGIILAVDEKTGNMLVQEGNFDGCSNPNWKDAIEDWETRLFTMDQLKAAYGNVVFANPVQGKVKCKALSKDIYYPRMKIEDLI